MVDTLLLDRYIAHQTQKIEDFNDELQKILTCVRLSWFGSAFKSTIPAYIVLSATLPLCVGV